jgi:hypothetical protein
MSNWLNYCVKTLFISVFYSQLLIQLTCSNLEEVEKCEANICVARSQTVDSVPHQLSYNIFKLFNCSFNYSTVIKKPLPVCDTILNAR